MLQILTLSLVVLGAQPPTDVLAISAELEAEALSVGPEYEIVLRVTIKDGWSASSAGVPAPLLQIDAPPAVKLSGKHLTSFKELSRNEFLQAPFERLLKAKEEHIEFKLVRPPGQGEQISFNVMAYVSDGPAESSYLIRRRVTLALTPGAQAVEADASKSDWGNDKHLLQIGDIAADFSLPKAFDPPVSLGQYLGQKNIVVTTYRAHW